MTDRPSTTGPPPSRASTTSPSRPCPALVAEHVRGPRRQQGQELRRILRRRGVDAHCVVRRHVRPDLANGPRARRQHRRRVGEQRVDPPESRKLLRRRRHAATAFPNSDGSPWRRTSRSPSGTSTVRNELWRNDEAKLVVGRGSSRVDEWRLRSRSPTTSDRRSSTPSGVSRCSR